MSNISPTKLESKNNQSTCLPHQTMQSNLAKNYSKEKIFLKNGSKIHMNLLYFLEV